MASTRRAFFFIKTEAAIGTAEALDENNDIYMAMRINRSEAVNTDSIPLEELTVDGAQAADIAGDVSLSLTTGYYFRGTGNVATAPYNHPFLKSALFDQQTVQKVDLSSVSGSFATNEEISGSAGKLGRVVWHDADNDDLYYFVTGLAFANGDSITGAGGGTADIASVPAADGFAYTAGQTDSSTPGYHATCRTVIDGFYYEMAGGLSDLTIAWTVRRPVDFQHTFNGAFSDHGDMTHPTISSYPAGASNPGLWVDADLHVGSYKPTGLGNLSIVFSNGVFPVSDAQALTGVSRTDFSRNAPTATFQVDQNSAADFDWLQAQLDSTTYPFRFEFGRNLGAGARLTFLSPSAGITATPAEGENNTAKFDISLGFSGGGEMLWFH